MDAGRMARGRYEAQEEGEMMKNKANAGRAIVRDAFDEHIAHHESAIRTSTSFTREAHVECLSAIRRLQERIEAKWRAADRARRKDRG